MTTFANGESNLSVRTKINNVLQHADGTAGELVINEAGADVDFRVESDTNANALFVDGATGNVGIGANSPYTKLDIVQATAGHGGWKYGASLNATDFPALRFLATTGNTGSIIAHEAGATVFLTGTTATVAGTERMRLDASGNLGLGVTPSAWGASFKAVQVGATGALADNGGGDLYLLSNARFDGTNFRYLTTNFANYYAQENGVHQWFNAPSGTAGNTISFTQAMTLDASGHLYPDTTTQTLGTSAKRWGTVFATGLSDGADQLVGSSSTTVKFGYGSAWTALAFATGGTERARIDASGNLTPGADETQSFGSASLQWATVFTNGVQRATSGDLLVNASNAAGQIAFRTAGNERARITAGGEVYIAGTTDQGAYNLQVNGTGVWGAGAYVNGSDERLKEEIADLANASEVVAQLRPVTFRYKQNYSKDQSIQPGFIAQELQSAMADQVYVDGVVQAGPEYLNVAYQALIPVLTKALQEAMARIEALEARLAAANL